MLVKKKQRMKHLLSKQSFLVSLLFRGLNLITYRFKNDFQLKLPHSILVQYQEPITRFRLPSS